MNIFEEISDMFFVEVKDLPASEGDIISLQNFSTIKVPNDYEEMSKIATELEINVKNQMYIRIWSPLGCIEMNEAHRIQKYIPESLAIGDDEGGYVLIYMEGKEGFGLYMVGFGNIDVEDAVLVAPSLRDLLINNIGIDVVMSGYV
ncbi:MULTISPECIES: SMI1/KNR4 family protein [Paenibacillus]|uniref:1,3-beta-glucan synthase regulator n=1 Tax=Paenibacillus ferrarius TaxID=1469647 RepID=A0A1V4H663_9BACL|nr:SMI1/KNR4 family protein [Paenibacillus ferrarius]OPH46706.1 1,3-beta-glucan synthase regulator [Paenibacillus ferrarius]